MASGILEKEFHYMIEQIFIVSFPHQIEAELFEERVIKWVNELNGAMKWIKRRFKQTSLIKIYGVWL